ncbi:hypothetical protein ROZALSC1DRAFT_29870 [Rozella allomycis CSF55]|uniref:Uncharacterized protein n=1 Tax=Rozella allomycis (strain CSF55) TaxID=988480 RepID=A0A4P9YGW1_ROZAC|nr:hypothetical protein ROZALSC1DRAFT_29870 [Rozella allomycis CSF55]
MFNGKFEKYQYIQDPIFKEFPLFLGERKRSEQCVQYISAKFVSADSLRITVDKSLIKNYTVFCLDKLHMVAASRQVSSMNTFDIDYIVNQKAAEMFLTREMIVFRKAKFQSSSKVEYGAFVYDENGRANEVGIISEQFKTEINDSHLIIEVPASKILQSPVLVDWDIHHLEGDGTTLPIKISVKKVLPPFKTLTEMTLWPNHHTFNQWQMGVDEIHLRVIKVKDDGKLEEYQILKVNLEEKQYFQTEIPFGVYLVCNEYGICLNVSFFTRDRHIEKVFDNATAKPLTDDRREYFVGIAAICIFVTFFLVPVIALVYLKRVKIEA